MAVLTKLSYLSCNWRAACIPCRSRQIWKRQLAVLSWGYIQCVRLRSTLLKQSWPFFKNLLIMAWYRLCMEWSWSLSHIHTMCQLRISRSTIIMNNTHIVSEAFRGHFNISWRHASGGFLNANYCWAFRAVNSFCINIEYSTSQNISRALPAIIYVVRCKECHDLHTSLELRGV